MYGRESARNFDYRAEGEAELEKFVSIQRKNNRSKELIENAETLMKLLQDSKKYDMQNHRDNISRVLINELAEKYYGSKEKLRYTLQVDHQLKEAIELLQDTQQYNKILAIM